jgi:hypothetical protein
VHDIAVFTLHKSASMFIHRQCEVLCQLAGLPYHSPNVPGSGLNARRLLTDPSVWHSRHGCFAPLRFYIDLPHRENYQILLHLRDPRDVLVSMFYSYCFIHAGEIAPDTGYRHEVAARGIDAFVLAKSTGDSGTVPGDYGTGGHVEDLIGNLPRRYRDYLEQLLGKPNVTWVKYEEMVSDYRGWLTKFIQPFAIRDERGVIERLVAQSAEFFPKRSQDAMSHVRHVAPGDHRAKLKPETIARLNEIYADVLAALGYGAGVCSRVA